MLGRLGHPRSSLMSVRQPFLPWASADRMWLALGGFLCPRNIHACVCVPSQAGPSAQQHCQRSIRVIAQNATNAARYCASR